MATILVMEDEILSRTAASEVLRERGYCVIEAASADEALSVLQSPTRIDLVLTDMRMPGEIDGVGLARHVRATLPFMRVVMISGQLPEPDVHGLLDGYLPKPVAPEHLASYLLALLPVRRASEVS
jgi:CheY-like chemotaxis protein